MHGLSLEVHELATKSNELVLKGIQELDEGDIQKVWIDLVIDCALMGGCAQARETFNCASGKTTAACGKSAEMLKAGMVKEFVTDCAGALLATGGWHDCVCSAMS